MILKIKLILLLLFVGNINYAQDWIKTDITDVASINFPSTSELTETQNESVYTAEDTFAYYLVIVRALTNQQSSRITKEEIPSLYDGFVNGAITAVNGEIISKNNITILGIPALELEYFAPDNPQLPSQRFKRIIYINQNIISIDFWPWTQEQDITNEKKAKFFNSLVINSIESKTTVGNSTIDNSGSTNTARDSGFFIGNIVFYVILLIIITCLFLLIRYAIKKVHTKNSTKGTIEPPHVKTTKSTCNTCNFENNANSKYCIRCGFELLKN